MTITIRQADPQRDYVRAAEIMQTFERQPVTAEMLKDWDARLPQEGILRRSIAEDTDRQTVGYGVVNHDTWMQEGYFLLWVITDPAYRGQGVGKQLYDEALAFALEQGATRLNSEVLDNDESSLAFAHQRGFSVRRHVFESTIRLDHDSYDESRFAGVIESVEASGIRLFSLADAGNTDEALYKLWQVNYQAVMDDPASDGVFASFEEFKPIILGGKWFRPDGQILAADGEQYVGLSAVGYFAETNSAYNMMTGVMPAYRGRKIALALKLLTIRAARRWGADFIRTNNDSQNAPMLAINRKLGYVAEPGLYRLVNTLRE